MDEKSKEIRTESRDLQVPDPKPDPPKTGGYPTGAEFPEPIPDPAKAGFPAEG